MHKKVSFAPGTLSRVINMRYNNCGEFSEFINPILNDTEKGKEKIEQIQFMEKSLFQLVNLHIFFKGIKISRTLEVTKFKAAYLKKKGIAEGCQSLIVDSTTK